MRVLVVEDEAALAAAIGRGLRRNDMVVDIALDGETATDRIMTHDYDVIVLDRDLPRRSGDDICRELVGSGSDARILMLTAASALNDRVGGFALGADDYLGKPFAFRELIARVRALGRRAGPRAALRLEGGDITLDVVGRRAWRGGRPLDLSRTEFHVLEALLRANGGFVSAEELLERVWDERINPLTNAVRVCVMRLRRKLGEPDAIVTVAGSGYRLQ